MSLVGFVLERSGKEKSQSKRVIKENENARTTHKQRERSKTYVSFVRVLLSLSSQKWSLSSSFVRTTRTKERKFPTRHLKGLPRLEKRVKTFH